MKINKSQLTNHHELRISDDIDCSSPILTDQSDAQLCDVNYIMTQYVKTGLLPENLNMNSRFMDNTTVPTLEEAFDIVKSANNAFYNLPAQIRRQMDNDPAQLENFILNPDNEDTLVKYGLITRENKEQETPKEQKAQVIPNQSDQTSGGTKL